MQALHFNMVVLRTSFILVLTVLAVFGLSLSSSFHFDDYAIFSDPMLTSSSGWWQVWRPLETRPLTYLTFWMNYELGGRSPVGYHAVNLALHLAAVLLLWDVLSRMVPRKAAIAASFLFALHPIQTEAIAYIFSRAILLATVFCLLSFRSWIRGRHWHAVAWFAVALLAKEECVAFPLFLLLLHFSSSRSTSERRPIGAMLGLSVAAGLRVLFGTAVHTGAGAGFQAGISPLEYLATQGLVILRYFRLVVFPWGFTIDPDIQVPSIWLGALAWLAILGTVYLASRRFSEGREGFWWIGGLILLAPSSSIFPAADLAADRRMYLPVCAFAVVAGLLIRNVKIKYMAPVACLLAILAFGRTQVWQTERSLWEEAVRTSPAKVRPKVQLARLSKPDKALVLLQEAQRLAPEDPRIPSAMGRVYMLLGQPQQALAAFGRALALAPRDAQALNNRGVALLAIGQAEAARQDFLRALRISPCLFDARFNLRRVGTNVPHSPDCHFSDEQRRLLSGREE
jgi:hypothetical protein